MIAAICALTLPLAISTSSVTLGLGGHGRQRSVAQPDCRFTFCGFSPTPL